MITRLDTSRAARLVLDASILFFLILDRRNDAASSAHNESESTEEKK